MASVKIEFNNSLHANSFTIWLEQEGLEGYKDSGYYNKAIDSGAIPLEDEVDVYFDESKRSSDHIINTTEIDINEEDED